MNPEGDVRIIVVGGGLSGLSAAHTVLERGGRVIVLDKNNFLGGNSTRATSGINGAGTSSQRSSKIEDSPELFYDDTARSARDLIHPDLVRVLTYNSAPAVEWLKSKFGLDLSLTSRLGGHSAPRTHRGKEKFPGMTITYALMEMLEEVCKLQPGRAKIVTKAQVNRLLTDSENRVVGVEYAMADNPKMVAYGPVILSTGGYAADFTSDSLLKKYRPDIYHLPTTNGAYSTGDGHKMAMAIGGHAIDLEKVQVHPTGLINPKEEDAKVLFLAAEALRGVGGLLLTSDGQRFCDELGHRDYVTGKMWEHNKQPYRLILNGAAARDLEWHCKHYMGRGLMKRFGSGEEVAREMGISPSSLEQTFSTYNEVVRTQSCPFGKRYFSSGEWRMRDEFYVSIVTPVLHYTMGGVKINKDGEIQGAQGSIPGLYAAGELAGGVHGANRLGGSSLLGCVVFGRVAGDSASRYLLEQFYNQKSSAGGASPGIISARLDPSSSTLTLSWSAGSGGHPSAMASASATASPTSGDQPPTLTEQSKSETSKVSPKFSEYTLDDVSQHNSEKDCWVVVQGQVLDVTEFMHEHPGGSKAILLYAGKDATEEFLMLHQPDVVAKYAPKTIIGKVKDVPASRAKL